MVKLGSCNEYLRYSKDSTGGGEYEHRLVAEQMLGRPLKEGEVVHHEDRNKRNNSPDNLMVFKSPGDHKRHHHDRGELIRLEDGAYIRTIVPKLPKPRIPKYKIAWPSKDNLHKLVWDKSTVKVSKDLGVSDKAIEKRCKSLGVPKPTRGFWRKIETQEFEGQYCPLP